MERALESLINSSKEHHHMASRTIFSLMLQSIVFSMVLTQSYEFPTIRGIVVEIIEYIKLQHTVLACLFRLKVLGPIQLQLKVGAP